MNNLFLNRIYKLLSISLCCLLLINTISIPSSAEESLKNLTNKSVDSNADSYNIYIKKYINIPNATNEIVKIASDYIEASAKEITIGENRDNENTKAIKSIEESTIEWEFDVPKDGMYNIGFFYYALKGKDANIERKLIINGEIPFKGANSLLFQRQWRDLTQPIVDKNGNERRPNQEEIFGWQNTLAKGSQDFTDDAYSFYLKAGKNRIGLMGGQESMEISSVALVPIKKLLTYKETQEVYKKSGYEKISSEPIIIQAEKTELKSDPMIYMVSDRTSPITQPNDVSLIKMNTIGGQNFRFQKQYISYKFDVPKSGLYQLGFRFKQNLLEGMTSNRRIYINGKVPFKELSSVSFPYDFNWQIKLACGNEPYWIYLDKGKNEIKVECVVGDISQIISILNDSVVDLNLAYRKVLMLTGAFPDKNRDYELDKELPECMELFEKQLNILTKLCGDLYKMTNSKGLGYSRINKMVVQLQSFTNNPDTIPQRLDTYRNNISDLTAWILEATEQPLLLDYIFILPQGASTPKADLGFFGKLVYESKSFIQSFFQDYNSIGSVSSIKQKSIELWMGSNGLVGATAAAVNTSTGRDQAEILQDLVNNSFSDNKNINVNIRLVDLSILLPAVASNKGPDVAINQIQTNPVNYALRGALYDLSSFSDCNEILKRFYPSSAVPFYIGKKLYALPETQVFSMLFYRTDILSELNISLPRTWSDIYKAIPILHRNYLDLGLPNISDNNLDVFFMMLYQNGGSVYDKDAKICTFDTPQAIETFSDWSELYTKYKVPQKIDALTRFRTGETPIVIAPFTFFNVLSASAPEIKGLWDFTTVPGTVKETGEVDRSGLSAATGAVIFKNTKNPKEAWEFLKWWTSDNVQLEYGKQMEVIQGAAARWPTANIEAFEQLPWTNEARKNILEQYNYTKGLEEVPGGYMTTRYVSNAIKLVINNGISPRESILDWTKKINDEITLKRKEFGMK